MTDNTAKRATRRDLMTYRWRKALDRVLGDVSTGTGGPPNDFAHSPQYPSRQHGMSNGHTWYSAWFDNDGFDLYISTQYSDNDESRVVAAMAAEDFRRIALWYLWRWAWGEWFGLRRRLFYWHLLRRVASYKKKRPAPPEEATP